MKSIEHIFSKKGPIADHLERYEVRQAQVDLARAVEDAVEQGGVLLGEAGTGTGKTLAYLVPAILGGHKVVVSTGTKNLQEQIYFRDLEFIQEALGIEVRTAYLKGQDNYLCKTRMHSFVTSPKCLSYPSKEVKRLTDWSNLTTTGDRMELSDLADDARIWSEVASTRETRIGQKCPHFDECFVTRARRQAMAADLVVVNHHLYFADIATRMRGGAILPGHEVVIFDEAHLIEDIATEFFSTKVSSYRLERAVGDSLAAVGAARLVLDPYESDRQTTAGRIHSLATTLFEMFRGDIGRSDLADRRVSEQAQVAYHKLDSTMESFEMSLKALEGQDEAIDHCASRIGSVRQDLGDVLECRDTNSVYWVETRKRSVVLGASPIDVSGQFRDEVLFKRDSVILCSATLSTSGNFDFFKSRLGVDFEAEEMIVDAPFDYTAQARVYLPRGIPDPRNERFVEAALGEIEQLVHLTGGGALVLCTSNRNMYAIHDALADYWEGPLLRQGEAPKSTLIEQFIREENGVLVATTSFWQGVDIPGDDLRLVVIDKLPFAAPGDPVTSARIAHLQEQGKSPFNAYQVPQAALALKQGFGRLIRTAFDRGIVAILDSRLHTKGYAKDFLSSLPPAPVVTDFEQLKYWWFREDGSGRPQ